MKEFLERKIKACEELGGMDREIWAFSQCLTELRKNENEVIVEFQPDKPLKSQLSALSTEKAAQNWFEQYYEYHKDNLLVYSNLSVAIGYFSDNKRNDLMKWFNLS